MTKNYYTEAEIECQVGHLLCIIKVSVSFNYYFRDAKGYDPAEEELMLLNEEILDELFFINGEETSTASAHKYYKIYCWEHFEEQIPKSLKEFLKAHLDAKKLIIAEEHLQNKI